MTAETLQMWTPSVYITGLDLTYTIYMIDCCLDYPLICLYMSMKDDEIGKNVLLLNLGRVCIHSKYV